MIEVARKTALAQSERIWLKWHFVLDEIIIEPGELQTVMVRVARPEPDMLPDTATYILPFYQLIAGAVIMFVDNPSTLTPFTLRV